MSAKVYFVSLKDDATPEDQAVALKKAYEVAGVANMIQPKDFVAIKFHVGEEGNTTHVAPSVIKELVSNIDAKEGQAFLVETSTLYKGKRENAVKHLLHAHQQGFGIDAVGAPFIMADGLLGTTEYEVQIDGELNKKVKVAREIMNADVLIVVSHPTGHIAAGLGASIKNVGMGLASRMGKLRQHSAMKPAVSEKKCRYCQKCIKWCPETAISEKNGKAFINSEVCVGCGECLAVCKFDAVKYDWAVESDLLQKHMAEHAYGVVKEKPGKCFFFNVMVNMTKDCDCFTGCQPKFIPDMGILASEDPVAVDMATIELTAKAHGKSLSEMAYAHHNAMIQIEHAAKVGMGSMKYELITIE